MNLTVWIGSIILAAVGTYWIIVELGSEEKTWFLSAGIGMIIPLIAMIIMKFKPKHKE